jgi:hypothetical protein
MKNLIYAIGSSFFLVVVIVIGYNVGEVLKSKKVEETAVADRISELQRQQQTQHQAPARPEVRVPFRFENEVCDVIYDTNGNPSVEILLFHDKITGKKYIALFTPQGGISSPVEFHEPEVKEVRAEKHE